MGMQNLESVSIHHNNRVDLELIILIQYSTRLSLYRTSPSLDSSLLVDGLLEEVVAARREQDTRLQFLIIDIIFHSMSLLSLIITCNMLIVLTSSLCVIIASVPVCG